MNIFMVTPYLPLMTLPEFNQMPFEDRHTFVLGNKKLQLKSYRYYYNQKVSLFGLDDFYIEVYYHRIGETITNIRAIAQDDDILLVYSEQMSKLSC
jgi:hypothetical protein